MIKNLVEDTIDLGWIIDLHIHTSASDGTDSIEEIMLKAKSNGLSAIAITDHDTVSGLRNISNEAKTLGIEIVNGAEFSVRFDSSMHILGLYIDIHNKMLLNECQKLTEIRMKLVTRAFRALKQNGLPIKPNQIISQKKYLSVSNMEEYLREHDLLRDRGELEDMFNEIRQEWHQSLPSPSECIALIHSCGGLAILAHPQMLNGDDSYLKKVISQLCSLGIDGIETIHPNHTFEDTIKLAKWAKELGLLCSGGSDYHGKNKYKKMKSRDDVPQDFVPYSYLDCLKKNLKGGQLC